MFSQVWFAGKLSGTTFLHLPRHSAACPALCCPVSCTHSCEGPEAIFSSFIWVFPLVHPLLIIRQSDHFSVRPAAPGGGRKPGAPHSTMVSFVSWVHLRITSGFAFPLHRRPSVPSALPCLPPRPASPLAPGCKARCILTRVTLGIYPQLSLVLVLG